MRGGKAWPRFDRGWMGVCGEFVVSLWWGYLGCTVGGSKLFENREEHETVAWARGHVSRWAPAYTCVQIGEVRTLKSAKMLLFPNYEEASLPTVLLSIRISNKYLTGLCEYPIPRTFPLQFKLGC